jgi:hypothetical protein
LLFKAWEGGWSAAAYWIGVHYAVESVCYRKDLVAARAWMLKSAHAHDPDDRAVKWLADNPE